jgi:hypothetical protein
MGVFGVNDVQQLESCVLPLCQVAGEAEEIGASGDKVHDNQKRTSLAGAGNRLLIFVNSHGPLLMELGAIAVDFSPTNSWWLDLAHLAECKFTSLGAGELPKSPFVSSSVF